MALIHIVQMKLMGGDFAGFRGDQAGPGGQRQEFAQNIGPFGLEDGAASDQYDVEVAGKVGPQIAVGFAKPAAGAVPFVCAQVDFLAGYNTKSQ